MRMFDLNNRIIAMQKFTKEELQKFYKDIQDLNYDSSSELEESFHEKEMQRLKSGLKSAQNAKNDHRILNQLKLNRQIEDEMITEYEQEVTELHRITRNQEKNVIDLKILDEIKTKVAQTTNNSVLQLADETYNQSVINQSVVEEKEQAHPHNFNKKSTYAQQIKKEEEAIRIKIQNANVERQQLAMEFQDKLSMKYEMECLSQLFSERFLRPKLKKIEQKDTKIRLVSTKLRNTFTNLTPQIVNQANVLPKNSPQIALKQLKLNKRKPLKAISQVSLKVTSQKLANNPQNFEQVPFESNIQEKSNKENIAKEFLSYIAFISKFVDPLQQISKNYSPKFLKFLDESQKNVNYELNQDEKGSKQKLLSQVASLQNAAQLKQLKLTFESITNLKGIQNFINIQDVQLQFNALNIIKPIQNCRKIIQLNLSHNKIKDISGIQSLPWLRLLNIEHNLVRELSLKCASLQIVWAGHNSIEDIDLNSNKYLRILFLNNNKLNQLPKIKLYNLQQLNLSKNQLKSLKNLEELILLKKLNVSHNRLEKVDEKLIYLYLNELNLSNNYISSLNFLFLPCLERLYLNNNRIVSRSKCDFYLPNLKELNLDENRLEGFSPIWQLLLYSRQVEYLRYSNNEYFLSLRQKIREIYEYIIYKYMQNIKIINENYMDIGIKKYYESNYDSYYSNITFFKSNNNIIKYLENNINFILHEFTFASELQKNKRSFIKEKQYISYQSVQKIKQLRLTINFIQQYSQQKNSMLSFGSSIFYHHDQFQLKKRHLYHKLRSLVIKRQYRKRLRLKYFLNNKPKTQQRLKLLQLLFIQSQTTKAVSKFKILLKGLNETQAAIRIQKMWRGYIRRKLYRKLKGLPMKRVQDSDEDEDVDTDFFNQQLQRHEFHIENIEGINFDDVIIRPEVFEYLQKKHQNAKNEKADASKNPKKKEEQEDKGLLVNNFLESQTKMKTKNEPKPAQWGITNEALLKTLQYKQKQRQKRRKQEEDKLLTATQRLERFRRGGV